MKKQSKNNYTVKIKVGDALVDVQGAESGVVKIVEALSEILRGTRRTGVSQPITPLIVSTPARSSHTDIRSFFGEKQPDSDIEAATAAAYYYQYLAPESDRRDTIDPVSLQEAFRLARRPLPKRTIYTLTNARNAGYLDSVGEGGQFRLNPVGYNLVEHSLGPSQAVDKQTKKDKRRRKTTRK